MTATRRHHDYRLTALQAALLTIEMRRNAIGLMALAFKHHKHDRYVAQRLTRDHRPFALSGCNVDSVPDAVWTALSAVNGSLIDGVTENLAAVKYISTAAEKVIGFASTAIGLAGLVSDLLQLATLFALFEANVTPQSSDWTRTKHTTADGGNTFVHRVLRDSRRGCQSPVAVPAARRWSLLRP